MVDKTVILFDDCMNISSRIEKALKDRIDDIRKIRNTMYWIEEHTNPIPYPIYGPEGIVDVEVPPIDPYKLTHITSFHPHCVPSELYIKALFASGSKKQAEGMLAAIGLDNNTRGKDLKKLSQFAIKELKRLNIDATEVQNLHEKWKVLKPGTYGGEKSYGGSSRIYIFDEITKAMHEDCQSDDKCKRMTEFNDTFMQQIKNFYGKEVDAKGPEITETLENCRRLLTERKIKLEEYPIITDEVITDYELDEDVIITDPDLSYFCIPGRAYREWEQEADLFEDELAQKITNSEKKYELAEPDEPEFMRDPHSGYTYWF